MTLSAGLNALYIVFYLFAVISFIPNQVFAQKHFVDCSSLSGAEATLIIPNETEPTLDGQPLAAGDEIAVFTPRGTCGGVGVWENATLAFTIWGDDSSTENVIDGFSEGETMSFRIWDASASVEYGGGLLELDVAFTQDPPYNSSGVYQTNGIYLLTGFAAETVATVDAADPEEKPSAYRLATNYPNPFSLSTTIGYDLVAAGWTTLIVYDVLGRQTEVLVNEQQQPGSYEIRFDGSNWPSGRYMYRLTSGEFSGVGTMVVSK